MDTVHDLLQRLDQAKGDTQAQAALIAEFLLNTRPESERENLSKILDAAAVLRWFDVNLLREVLEISTEEAHSHSEALNSFPFVERRRRGSNEVCNLHDSVRLGWRRKIAKRDSAAFRLFSNRATKYLAMMAPLVVA
jgi:hypothetical protein